MKKIKILGVVAALLASFFVNVVPVSATGNCTTAQVTVYGAHNQSGGSRAYCYGVNDADVSSEIGGVMGPLSNGTFQNDFDSVSGTSGISSVAYKNGNNNVIICFYLNKNYSGTSFMATTESVDNLFHDRDNTIESMHFWTSNFC